MRSTNTHVLEKWTFRYEERICTPSKRDGKENHVEETIVCGRNTG